MDTWAVGIKTGTEQLTGRERDRQKKKTGREKDRQKKKTDR